MASSITWITKGGKHIPIIDGKIDGKSTNDYMNDYIRNKGKGGNSNAKKIEELQKEYDDIKNMFDPRKAELKEKIEALKQGKDLKTYKKEKEAKESENRRQDKIEREQRLLIKEKQAENKNEQEYMMSHRPSKTGVTADDLTNPKAESPMPKDAYEHPEYYSVIGKKYTEETMTQLRRAKGNKNAKIIIYRATTGNKINKGDWVTLSKSYAENHKKTWLNNKGKVIEKEVKAKDIQFAGDDLAEWGYFPQ